MTLARGNLFTGNGRVGAGILNVELRRFVWYGARGGQHVADNTESKTTDCSMNTRGKLARNQSLTLSFCGKHTIGWKELTL